MEAALAEQTAGAAHRAEPRAGSPFEAINSSLRRAGQPVHCTWISALRDLADAIEQINPELLIHVAGSEDLRGVIALRDQVAAQASCHRGLGQ